MKPFEDSTRAHAAELDSADPLARFRGQFVIADPDLIYLDGNSLGRLTHGVAGANPAGGANTNGATA